jgi:uncharacterized membrane protein (UPF0127 family)
MKQARRRQRVRRSWALSSGKRPRIWVFATVWAISGLLSVASSGVSGASPRHSSGAQARPGDAKLVEGKIRYDLKLAITPAQQAQGLSGLKSLPDNTGMLFVFPGTALRCFWMKGMHFALDVVWLSAGDEVQLVDHDLTPRTYPMTFCVEAHSVIELVGGQAKAAGITRGRTLTIKMPAS